MKDNNKPYRVIISGGGTGGHIFPAVAIANELKRRNPSTEILFIGALGKMEMTRVPEAGYPIKGLWISGLQRRFTLQNLLFPFKLINSYLKALKIMRQFKPQAVVGTGGYASGPSVMAANRKGIPVLLQEQNSYPGLTNRKLARKAKKVCVAYEGMEKYFDPEKIIFTGNPVRNDILDPELTKEKARQKYGLNGNKKTILVLGGSLGARTINESIMGALDKIAWGEVQVIWQTGKIYYEEMLNRLGDHKPDGLFVMQFINDMEVAYSAADLIISRAGALSISELCIVAKPVIFVPSPNVAADHQTKNAMALVEKNAAVLVKDEEAVEGLVTRALKLLYDQSKSKMLSENIKALGKPQATKDIVDQLNLIIN
ncbi:MAG: undecaprenyldiphospho-muramoylpentapeptide beta-N-acetylglucosaminyltransferase [Cyclobacteriaceae bacterium]|nr:undecaprenyldiphospho-muramoylpentapeptide beta-N-acetylglucosaminyltransferase [Cyclobacteriaceae bacterium]